MSKQAIFVTSKDFEFLRGDSKSPKLNAHDLHNFFELMEGIESMVDDHVLDVKPATMKKLNSWQRCKPIMQRVIKNAMTGAKKDYPFIVTGVQAEGDSW